MIVRFERSPRWDIINQGTKHISTRKRNVRRILLSFPLVTHPNNVETYPNVSSFGVRNYGPPIPSRLLPRCKPLCNCSVSIVHPRLLPQHGPKTDPQRRTFPDQESSQAFMPGLTRVLEFKVKVPKHLGQDEPHLRTCKAVKHCQSVDYTGETGANLRFSKTSPWTI